MNRAEKFTRRLSVSNSFVNNRPEENPPTCADNMTPIVLLIGLGAHSIFEGIAVGTNEKMDRTLMLAIAIFLHKGSAGMALGIALNKAFEGRKTFVSILISIFAIFTPIGIILGIILQSFNNKMLEIVFSCLAAGTFIYIACSEVIISEFSQRDGCCAKYSKTLFFVMGIIIIGSLKFFEPDDD